ncbi:glycosyltransferase family 4 protein [Lonsdalea quercina]|uniref:glycosyltransferase family 4 protein n=1 Tax=Lonsdalea quercina TaxID=71657 RepID=UPI0039771E7C
MKSKTLLYVINIDWYFKLHWLNRALASIEAGYQVKLISAFLTKNVKKELEGYGIECFDIKLSRNGINPFSEIVTLYYIYKIVAKIRPDIIHSITVKPNLYAGMIGKWLDIPVVKSITGTGAIFSSQLSIFKLLKPMVVSLYRYIGRGNKGAFVFENKEDQNLFRISAIGKSQLSVHISGAGVDSKEYVFSDRIFDQDKVRILFAARMLKDKGLDTLLEALDILYKKRQDFELIIAGILDPYSFNAYHEHEIIDISCKGFVRWVGQRDDINKLLTEVDIVALPTRYGEGVPRILIEAGFTGRVVITTDVKGCRELIDNKKTGYLMMPNNTGQLICILENIFSNKSAACNCAKNLYYKVNMDFSDEAVIKKILHTYRELLKFL